MMHRNVNKFCFSKTPQIIPLLQTLNKFSSNWFFCFGIIVETQILREINQRSLKTAKMATFGLLLFSRKFHTLAFWRNVFWPHDGFRAVLKRRNVCFHVIFHNFVKSYLGFIAEAYVWPVWPLLMSSRTSYTMILNQLASLIREIGRAIWSWFLQFRQEISKKVRF